LYSGLWRTLVQWFAVPDQPPDLPVAPGETLEKFRPANGFLRYLKFWFWLVLLVIDGALLLAWLGSFFIHIWVGILLMPVFLAVAILPDVLAYIAIHLRYDTTWYVLSSRSLRIRRGIWVIWETTITFENVQDVKIRQGPVQRMFGIADVLVETAGGGGQAHEASAGGSHRGLIEGIADAPRVRDLILAKVRRSQSAGLGDESDEHTRPHRGPSWSKAHLQVLREIHHQLASLPARPSGV
jgi:membrane protein YdbS with pleckstrin-like domain